MYPSKPHFFGEFGIGANADKLARDTALHNGLWASVVSASSAAASTWYWTYPGYVEYEEFGPLSKAIHGWPFAERDWGAVAVITASGGKGVMQGFGMSGRRLPSEPTVNSCKDQSPLFVCDPVGASTHVWVWLRHEDCTFEKRKQKNYLTSATNITLMGDISLGQYKVQHIDTSTGKAAIADHAKQCYEGLCHLTFPSMVCCDAVIILTLLGG
jgi:hypothetical protein